MSAFDYRQHNGDLWVQVPTFRTHYLRAIMRSDSFIPLLELFRHAHDPVKEFTESYSALRHLRPWQSVPKTVYHIGDGAWARTAAMFAFMTKHMNIAIDPITNVGNVSAWQDRFMVDRFYYAPLRVEDYQFTAYQPCLVTFVHAHVDTDAVLDRLGDRWVAAYTCACCEPEKQLGRKYKAHKEGEDWGILSPERRYRVFVNPNHRSDAS